MKDKAYYFDNKGALRDVDDKVGRHEMAAVVEDVETVAVRSYRKTLLIDCQETFAGVNVSGTLTLQTNAASINSIMAFVTATGAPAATALLTLNTDYSFVSGGKVITILTNQLGNTLVVNYNLAK